MSAVVVVIGFAIAGWFFRLAWVRWMDEAEGGVTVLRSASIMSDHLEIREIPARKGRGSRRKCECCGKRQTHHLLANGMAMGFAGCEMYAWRWKRKIETKRGFR